MSLTRGTEAAPIRITWRIWAAAGTIAFFLGVLAGHLATAAPPSNADPTLAPWFRCFRPSAMTCTTCGDRGTVHSVEGLVRPCSQCRFDDFRRWADARRPKTAANVVEIEERRAGIPRDT